MGPFTVQRMMQSSLRQYSHHSAAASAPIARQMGAIAAIGYCCLAFSAPFAGAAVVSKRAGRDQRYANMRPLSFRDCLPCSPLEDYAGALRR